MPIISTIGRRQWKLRGVIGLIYAVLLLGSVTMVYPFMVMIATSFTSEVDKDEFRTVPLSDVHEVMRGRIIFDGRNILNRETAEAAGFAYMGVGRRSTQNRRRVTDD